MNTMNTQLIADLAITESIQKGETGLLEKRLTENPALAESTTREGLSLLLFALYCGRANHGVAAELIKRYKPALDCYEAACLGELGTLTKILDQTPALINTPSVDGFSLLGYACFFNQPAIAEYLIEKGADVNHASDCWLKMEPASIG